MATLADVRKALESNALGHSSRGKVFLDADAAEDFGTVFEEVACLTTIGIRPDMLFSAGKTLRTPGLAGSIDYQACFETFPPNCGLFFREKDETTIVVPLERGNATQGVAGNNGDDAGSTEPESYAACCLLMAIKVPLGAFNRIV